MDERQKIDWAQQDKKLLLLLEKQQALPTNHPFSMAKLDEEILAVEELLRSYQSAARQRTPLAILLRPALFSSPCYFTVSAPIIQPSS
jgi:hypothetical protein